MTFTPNQREQLNRAGQQLEDASHALAEASRLFSEAPMPSWAEECDELLASVDELLGQLGVTISVDAARRDEWYVQMRATDGGTIVDGPMRLGDAVGSYQEAQCDGLAVRIVDGNEHVHPEYTSGRWEDEGDLTMTEAT